MHLEEIPLFIPASVFVASLGDDLFRLWTPISRVLCRPQSSFADQQAALAYGHLQTHVLSRA